MRASDLARLSEHYHEEVRSPDPGPMSALGVGIPGWKQLEVAIFADLVEQLPYGIGWWAPHPGTKKRILISDHLYACTTSVADNMIEAGLHWLEFQDYAERENSRYADAVKIRGGSFVAQPPRCESPLDELGAPLVRMHVAGVVRALAGALDCLAGTVIGIVALPQDILRADFRKVHDGLRKMRNAPAFTEGRKRQDEFGKHLDDHIASAGPKGWLDWMLAFRNMLVHRGRRVELGQYLPKDAVLYGPDGQRVPWTDRVTHLPREPHRSDIDVFLSSPQALVLTEDSAQTLQGLLDSAKRMIELVAKDLAELWCWRRSNPEKLAQPEAQWRDSTAGESAEFDGYKPGTVDISASAAIIVHPIQARRFYSSALDDTARPQWDSFD